MNISLNCILFNIMWMNCCTVLYQFWQVFFISETNALAYCLVFLDCFEIWLFPLVKQSELKPLMNGNMILLLMSVMCKVEIKSSYVSSFFSELWTVVGKSNRIFLFKKCISTFLGHVDSSPISAGGTRWRYGSLVVN